MKLFILAAVLAICSGDKLDRTYLPPVGSKSAGGSPGSLQPPIGPSDGTSSAFEGVAVDSAEFTPAGRIQTSGLGAPASTYGSENSRVGDAAFRGAQPSFTAQQKFGPNGLSGFNAPHNTFNAFQQSGPGLGINSFNSQQQASIPNVPSHSTDGQSSYNTQSVPQESYSQQSEQQPERPQASQDRAAEIIHQDSDVKPDGFKYSFETDNGIAAEENAVATNGVQAQGAFSYMGDDGQMYSVTYTADENGYHPQGAHLPTPPPIPEAILKSIEQNMRDEAAGIVDDGAYDAQKYDDEGQDSSVSTGQQFAGDSGQYSQYQRKPNSGPPGNFGIPSQGVTQSSYLPPTGSGSSSFSVSSQKYTQQGPSVSDHSQQYNGQDSQSSSQPINASEKQGTSQYDTQSRQTSYHQSTTNSQGSQQVPSSIQQSPTQQYTYKKSSQYNSQGQSEPQESSKQNSYFQESSHQQNSKSNREFSGSNDATNQGPSSSSQESSSQKYNFQKNRFNAQTQPETQGSAQMGSTFQGSSEQYNVKSHQGSSLPHQQSPPQHSQSNSQSHPKPQGSAQQQSNFQGSSQEYNVESNQGSSPNQQAPSQQYNYQYDAQSQSIPKGSAQQGSSFQESSQYNAQGNLGFSSPTQKGLSQDYNSQTSQQYTSQSKPGSHGSAQQGSSLQGLSNKYNAQVTQGPITGTFQQYNAKNNVPSSQSHTQQYNSPQSLTSSHFNAPSNKLTQQYLSSASFPQKGSSQQGSSQKYSQQSSTFQSSSNQVPNNYNTLVQSQPTQGQFNTQFSQKYASPTPSNSQTELSAISHGPDGSSSLFSPRPTGSSSDDNSHFASRPKNGFPTVSAQNGNNLSSPSVSQKYTTQSFGQLNTLSNDAYQYNPPATPFNTPGKSQTYSSASRYSMSSHNENSPQPENISPLASQGPESQSYSSSHEQQITHNAPSQRPSVSNQYNFQAQQNTLQTSGQSQQPTGPSQQYNLPTQQSTTSQQYSGEIYQYKKPESAISLSPQEEDSSFKLQSPSPGLSQQFSTQTQQTFGSQPSKQFDSQPIQQFGAQQVGSQASQQFNAPKAPSQQYNSQSQYNTGPSKSPAKEEFGGPRQPPSFSPESGYHY